MICFCLKERGQSRKQATTASITTQARGTNAAEEGEKREEGQADCMGERLLY